MLTHDDIAKIAGISVQAVRKRSQNLTKYLISEMSFGGRPRRFYSDDILKEFGINAMAELTKQVTTNDEVASDVVRKRSKNTSSGKNRLISEELEQRIKSLTLTHYLQQARKDNIELCTKWAISDLWNQIEREIEGKKDAENFAWYFYNKRIMRKDAKYTGYAHKEKWYLLWDNKHSVNKFNSSLPTSRWNMVELLTNAGIIGQGFGAGLVWFIDGTQFDSWIDDNGKKKTMNYLCVSDGITGMPLYLDWLENGEKIEDVAKILWKAVNLHGKPKWGVMMDNGAAFKSIEIKNVIRSWYMPAELENLKNDTLRKRIFDGQTEPFLLPVAKIPRHVIKAAGERQFDELNRFMSEQLPLSYIGTRDSRLTSHELGTTPIAGVNAAPTRKTAFGAFLTWIYNDYIYRIQPKFTFLSEKKIKPSICSAFEYLGGTITNKEVYYLPADLESIKMRCSKEIPEFAKYYYLYAISKKHSLKAGLGSVVFTQSGKSFNIISDSLDITLANQTVSVCVVDAVEINEYFTGKKALIFKEYSKFQEDSRTPNADSLYFVGFGENAIVESEKDIAKCKNVTRTTRKSIMEGLREFTNKATGGKIIEIKNLINSSKYENNKLDDIRETAFEILEESLENDNQDYDNDNENYCDDSSIDDLLNF